MGMSSWTTFAAFQAIVTPQESHSAKSAITTTNASDFYFNYNATNASTFITFPGSSYMDVVGNVYTNSLTLSPWSSKVLLKYTSPPIISYYVKPNNNFIIVNGSYVTVPIITTSVPVVATVAITNINSSTATSGGNITSNGYKDITSKGVCWSTAFNPTINSSLTNDGIGMGLYGSNLISLNSSTLYHVRAYAANSVGVGYGLDVSFNTTTTSVTAPAVISDGSTFGWYIASDLTTVTKDGSNKVSLWQDKLASGHDLSADITYATLFYPTWSANGITFDGVYNVLHTTAFTLNQPAFIYIVLKEPTSVLYSRFFDGYQGTDCGGVYDHTTYIQQVVGGSTDASLSALSANTWVIMRSLFNGSSSKLIVNNGTPATGAGTLNSTALGGFTLGGSAEWSNSSNIVVKEVIVRAASDSSANQTLIYNYLNTKYSLGL
jgi:hypothetical protein